MQLKTELLKLIIKKQLVKNTITTNNAAYNFAQCSGI